MCPSSQPVFNILTSAPFRDFTQRGMVVPTDVSGQPIGPIFKGQALKDGEGTGRLSRNFGKKLLYYSA